MQDILVVKLGGGAGLDVSAAVNDLTHIARRRPLVVVHGVSERMAQLCEARGIEVEMLTSPTGHSSRYTPPPVRDVFIEAASQVNVEIVDGLLCDGIFARGVIDEIAIRGERKAAVRAVVGGRVRMVRDDYTGIISGVERDLILSILRRGEVAVVPPLAASDDGLLNIDGDRAAAAVAGAIQASELIILSNVRGLYRNYPDENSFMRDVPQAQLDQAMLWAQGRMKRKVLSAQEALQGGISRVVIGDGRAASPVSCALQGEGTVFTR